MMPGCGSNMTNQQRLLRQPDQYSEVFPTWLLYISLQSMAIGHILPKCEEADISCKPFAAR